MSVLLALLLTTSLANPGPRGEGPPPLPPPLLDFAYDEDESGSLDAQEQAYRDADLADGHAAIVARGKPPKGECPPPHPPGPPPRLEKGQVPPPIVEAFDDNGDGKLDAAERRAARIEIQERIRTGRPPHPH